MDVFLFQVPGLLFLGFLIATSPLSGGMLWKGGSVLASPPASWPLGLPWGILAAGQGIVGSALAVAVFVDYIVGVLCVPAQGSQHRLDQGAPGAGLVLTQNLLVLVEAVAHGFQGGGRAIAS